MGFAVSGVTFLLMLYTLYARLVRYDYEPGWASLMMSLLLLGGVQLIAVCVIGEYMARRSANVPQRPLCIITESSQVPATIEVKKPVYVFSHATEHTIPLGASPPVGGCFLPSQWVFFPFADS